jgi:hypothetical protein
MAAGGTELLGWGGIGQFHFSYLTRADYGYIRHAACIHVAGAETSVRVSRSTLAELERFRGAIRASTLDDAIHSLLMMKRKELLAEIYGSARGVRPFRESDRLDTDR